MSESVPISRNKYKATVAEIDGSIVAMWQDNLYQVGEQWERRKSGRKAANHDGLILRNQKVYTAVRDHKGLSDSQAVLYLGRVPTRLATAEGLEVIGQYTGIRGVAKARPLHKLSTIDPDAKAYCNVCRRKTSVAEDGVEYLKEMEDHINEDHISDGKLAKSAVEEMYEVK